MEMMRTEVVIFAVLMLALLIGTPFGYPNNKVSIFLTEKKKKI